MLMNVFKHQYKTAEHAEEIHVERYHTWKEREEREGGVGGGGGMER